GVVTQDTGGRHGQRGPLVRGVAVAAGDGGVVDRADRDRHVGEVTVQGPVVGPVGEGVGAVEVRGRRVDEGPVAVQGEGAVGGAADQDRLHRAAVHVGVVTQDAGRRHGQRRVLVGGETVVGRHRGVVDRPHRDGYSRHVAVGAAVVGLVGETVGAVEVW